MGRTASMPHDCGVRLKDGSFTCEAPPIFGDHLLVTASGQKRMRATLAVGVTSIHVPPSQPAATLASTPTIEELSCGRFDSMCPRLYLISPAACRCPAASVLRRRDALSRPHCLSPAGTENIIAWAAILQKYASECASRRPSVAAKAERNRDGGAAAARSSTLCRGACGASRNSD